MATIQEAIKRLVYQFTSTGADKVAADLGKVGDAQAAVAASSQKTEQASLSLDKSFANLERRFDSTIRAQQDYQKVQDKVNAAVAQNPELQDRANNVLAKASDYYDRAKGSAGAFNAILDAGRGAALGYAAGIGPIGAVLGSFGPLGVAAAAGIGIVVAALERMARVSEEIGSESSGLKQFADTTGLTITQVRGLTDAGTSLGVSSDQMASAIQRFTLNLGEARKGGGDLFEQLRVIDRQLADSVSNTRDGASALDILTKAYNSTADATAKAAIARAAFGKGGGAVGPVLSVVGDAGGVDAYSAAVAKALGVTDQWTAKVAALRNQQESLKGDLKLVEGSIYTAETLERGNRLLEQQIAIAKAFRDAAAAASEYFKKGGSGPQADEFGQPFDFSLLNENKAAKEAAAAATQGLTAATNGLAQANATSTAATIADTTATAGQAQARINSLDAATRAAAASSAMVAALGSAATIQEKEKARVDALTVSLDKGAISWNTYVRAVQSAHDDSVAAEDAQERALDAVREAQNSASDSADAAADAQQRAADAAVAWQQNLFGVSVAANSVAASIDAAALAEYNADQAKIHVFVPNIMPANGGTISANPLNNVPVSYRGGGAGRRLDIGGGDGTIYAITDFLNKNYTPDKVAASYLGGGDYKGALSAVEGMGQFNIPGDPRIGLNGFSIDPSAQFGLVDRITKLLNQQTSDKGEQVSNLQSEMAWLNTLPQTLDRDEKIVSLQQSIDDLKKSTDGLNSTNQDMLSPFYSQDPRTSHIGFRSQGMAAGGYVDVPGSPSANDNMTAIIPVASGERIYVDPQSAKRGLDKGGGTSQTVSITNHITVGAGADKNEVGRTVFQATQNAMRQFRAAS